MIKFRKRPARILVEKADGSAAVRPKKPRQNPEESHVQRPLVRLLRQIENYTHMLTFFAVPNQLLRTPALRKIFYGLGGRAGVPDLVIPITGGRTLWVELKYNGNGLSDDQKEFRAVLHALGHDYHVIDARNSTEAQRALYRILAAYGIDDFRLITKRNV